MLHADRKSTQRERLLNGIVEVTVRDGYQATTIAEVIAAAGVSRPTFYEYFEDKADCFTAALADIQDGLLLDVARAVRDSPPEKALHASAQTLIVFAASQPARARFVTGEPLAGGPRTLQARDDGIERLARIVEQAQATLPAHKPAPDVSARVLLGALHRLVAQRLREGQLEMSDFSHDLAQWIDSYTRPIGEHGWRTQQPARAPEPSALLPETLLREPPEVPQARRRSKGAVAENQRQRILYAIATVAQEKGYAASTIGEITRRAGVDHRTFNALFTSKQEAFMALIALGFQRTMAITARAFSTGADWPDRVWEAGRAFTEFLQSNPALAHVGFIEPHAVGPAAARQMEGSLTAFTIFLHEGLRQSGDGAAEATPQVLEAIATSIFETGYHESRRRRVGEISRLLPHVTFLCMAPLIGAQAADKFIEGKLKSGA